MLESVSSAVPARGRSAWPVKVMTRWTCSPDSRPCTIGWSTAQAAVAREHQEPGVRRRGVVMALVFGPPVRHLDAERGGKAGGRRASRRVIGDQQERSAGAHPRLDLGDFSSAEIAAPARAPGVRGRRRSAPAATCPAIRARSRRRARRGRRSGWRSCRAERPTRAARCSAAPRNHRGEAAPQTARTCRTPCARCKCASSITTCGPSAPGERRRADMRHVRRIGRLRRRDRPHDPRHDEHQPAAQHRRPSSAPPVHTAPYCIRKHPADPASTLRIRPAPCEPPSTCFATA